MAESVVAIVVTPAIGGEGWMTAYEATFEYSCAVGATVSFVAADEGNDSYAPNAIALAATGGKIAKYTIKVSPSKWKLLQAVFTSTDASFALYLQGTGLSVKPWGSDKAFTFVPFFIGAKVGGEGPQN